MSVSEVDVELERKLGFELSDRRQQRYENENGARKAARCAACKKDSFGCKSRSTNYWYPYCDSCLENAEPYTPVSWARGKDEGPFNPGTERYETFSFELNVPSGAMMVGNGFGPYFSIYGEVPKIEWNELRILSELMAAAGCAYAYVGNSCPSVYKVGEDRFIIGSGTPNPEYAKVAWICTDLWWWSIVDEDEFKRRGAEKRHSDATRVTVTPGVYRFTHQMFMEEDEVDFEIFTRIERVRDPDPIVDFAAREIARNFTAGQIIGQFISDFPRMYHGSDAEQGVADRIFCLSGSRRWHPNGFMLRNALTSPDIPEAAIPVFEKEYDWQPLDEKSSGLCLAAEGKIKLNPSFAALAINVAECIVKYGSGRYPENVQIAQRCLEGLRRIYP